MSDLLHTHLTIGLAPVGECPACEQTREAFDACACGCGCEPDGDWHWSQRPWCPCISQGCPCVTDTPAKKNLVLVG